MSTDSAISPTERYSPETDEQFDLAISKVFKNSYTLSSLPLNYSYYLPRRRSYNYFSFLKFNIN